MNNTFKSLKRQSFFGDRLYSLWRLDTASQILRERERERERESERKSGSVWAYLAELQLVCWGSSDKNIGQGSKTIWWACCCG